MRDTVTPATAPAHAALAGRRYALRSAGCADAFTADPLVHLTEAPDALCGMTVPVAGAEQAASHEGVRYSFRSPGCRDAFAADPAHLGQVADRQ